MEDLNVNHWAVIVSAISNLAVGALWYSPLLFYRAWQKETGLTDEILKTINPAKLYTLSCLFSLVICYNMAFFLATRHPLQML